MNPLPNWGPMMRARASKTEDAIDKRAKNQGKYSKRKHSNDANGQAQKKANPEVAAD